MSRRKHSGYRGRGGVRNALSTVLAVILILAALAAAGLALGRRYIVYTDEGVRLELPFFQRDKQTGGDMSVPPQIIQLPQSAPAQSEPDAQGA